MMTKNITLIIVVIAVIGSIIYLESGKVKAPEGDVGIVEIPILEETLEETTMDNDVQKPSATSPKPPEKKSEIIMVAPDPSARLMSIEDKAKKYERAKEITTPDGFINTDGQPITIAENIGKKVILLDIWTYSCINCQRTIPYINSWQEKYGDKGLLIIGLHTPEFEFEKEYANVLAAVEKFGIKYPVVMDNDYSTWRAYRNNYWPRKYIIDIDGFIVYDHIGEGAYEDTEKKIQELLKERSGVLGDSINTSLPVTKQTTQTYNANQSPETYFGSWRNSNFGNGQKNKSYSDDFVLPEKLNQNEFYLRGKWKIEREYIEALESGASFYFPYNAKDVYMVAESAPSQNVKVYRDDKVPATYAGSSLNDDATALVGASELYKLIKEASISSHTLKVEASEAGFRVYTLTFGS